MKLQKLVIKQGEHDKLYYRCRGDVKILYNGMNFGQGGSMSTDTYFNSLSIEKWYRYCDISDILLNFLFSGYFNMKIMHSCFKGDRLCSEIIAEEELKSQNATHYQYTLPRIEEGVVYFVLESKTAESVLYDAYYECVPVKTRDVTIALNICTYKREKYLLRNLSLLQSKFLNDRNSELYGHLKVFIVDNGNTLDCEQISGENVLVCHNPNVGGAGGFTRGLIEILNRRDEMAVTHAIFMDDDIEIEPESIIRTYRLLTLLKEEYWEAFISGAMLRIDKPNIQHENGALWNEGKCQFINRGIDLEYFENVVRNESSYARDYAAWWYCCIPASVISEDNLPIPVFIHEDDVEYSLRNARNIITLNGIAVRHPVTDHKRVSSNEYYNLRNLLIVNAVYCPEYGRKQVSKKMLTNLLMALLRFRYKDMRLVYRALEDFCKGPEWLLHLDAVSYHKRIQQEGYQLFDMKEKLKSCKHGEQADNAELISIHSIIENAKKDGILHKRMIQILSLNGWLLPAKKETYAYFMGVHPVDLYRMGKIILYDDVSVQGIEVERSFKQIFVFIWLYIKSLFLIMFRYGRSRKAYQKHYKELHNIGYWEEVLGLK